MSFILWPFKVILWLVTFTYYSPWEKEKELLLPEVIVYVHIGVAAFPSSRKAFVKEWDKLFSYRGYKIIDYIVPGLSWKHFQGYYDLEIAFKSDKHLNFSDYTGEGIARKVEESGSGQLFESLICSSLLTEIEESKNIKVHNAVEVTDEVLGRKREGKRYLGRLDGIKKLIYTDVLPETCPGEDCGVFLVKSNPDADGTCHVCDLYLGEDAEKALKELHFDDDF